MKDSNGGFYKKPGIPAKKHDNGYPAFGARDSGPVVSCDENASAASGDMQGARAGSSLLAKPPSEATSSAKAANGDKTGSRA